MAIVSCLVDTNILLRSARRSDPQHQLIDTALATLLGRGIPLFYTHQNIAELWNVMTRPLARNGLGLDLDDVQRHVGVIEAAMTLLHDNEGVYWEWKKMVVQYAITGVQVHDARLAATMRVHRVKHILTLNISDFSRFDAIIALHPNKVE